MSLNYLNRDYEKVDNNFHNYRTIRYIEKFISTGVLERALLFDKREFEIEIDGDDIISKITFNLLDNDICNRYQILQSMKISGYSMNNIVVYATNLIFGISDLELLNRYSCLNFDIDNSSLDCDIVRKRLNNQKINLNLLYQRGCNISTSALTQLGYEDLIEDSLVLNEFEESYKFVNCLCDDIVFDSFNLKLNSVSSLFEYILNDRTDEEFTYLTRTMMTSLRHLNLCFNYNSLIYFSRLNSNQIKIIVEYLKSNNISLCFRLTRNNLELYKDNIYRIFDDFDSMLTAYICDINIQNIDSISINDFNKINSSKGSLEINDYDLNILKFLILKEGSYK